MSNDPFSDLGASFEETLNSLGDTVNSIGASVEGSITSFFDSVFGQDPNAFRSAQRAAGIPAGAEPNNNYVATAATFSVKPEEKDWRVRISHPMLSDPSYPIFNILGNTNGMVFPNLPTVNLGFTANYQQIDTVHTNYPFYAYKNSQPDEITITGRFTVQNQFDGKYWLASMHFLRTITKMYFGQGPNLGNPPPICTLNGYGDFVFNEVSCIVKSFSISLPNDVDYIAVSLGTSVRREGGSNLSYIPTASDITVVVQPVYSRDKIKSFNLDAFAKGQLIVGSDGKGWV